MDTQIKPYEVVVGLDFSELSERALEEAVNISSRSAPAELHVICVAEQLGLLLKLPGDTKPLEEEAARERARQLVADVVNRMQEKQGNVALERVAVYVVTGEPARMITDLAQAVDASLIIVGTHGRHGIQRVLLGSVAANVVRDAPCGVYVVRPADFVGGKKVPEIAPPLQEGEPHLKHFEHRRTYHYVDKVAPWTNRTMPAS